MLVPKLSRPHDREAEGCHAGAEWVWCRSLGSPEAFSARQEPRGRTLRVQMAGKAASWCIGALVPCESGSSGSEIVTERRNVRMDTAMVTGLLVLMFSACMQRES